jgi:hypothetical protein
MRTQVFVRRKDSAKKVWGWAFELKCDSLPRLGFKEVACMLITLIFQLPNWLIKMSIKGLLLTKHT